MSPDPARAEIVVDLAAIRHNVRRLGRWSPDRRSAMMMTVVKADGYGHGMRVAAAAARAGGADWLGVATIDEAVALRDGGDTGRSSAGSRCRRGLRRGHRARHRRDGVLLADLEEIEDAARGWHDRPRAAKVDTGLSRGGCAFADSPTARRRGPPGRATGRVDVTGVWSHFACSDEPEHPANDLQERSSARRWRSPTTPAWARGSAPRQQRCRDPAPGVALDLVRCGIAASGSTPRRARSAPPTSAWCPP